MIDEERLPARALVGDWTRKPSILREIRRLQNLDSWSRERWRKLRAVYYGMIARLDEQFAMVLDALRESGAYGATAVFLFSDHGDFTGDYGLVEKTQNTFEDCLVNVPLVVKPPQSVPVTPGVRDCLVELVDLPATVFDMCGIEPGYTHFGRSLLPLLGQAGGRHRDAVFSEGGRRHGELHCMEIESNPDLDPRDEYWPRMVAQRSEGPEHTKAAMCRTRDYKYVYRLYEDDELYDLDADPREMNNLSGDAEYREVEQGLRDRLLRWYVETCDAVPFETDQRR